MKNFTDLKEFRKRAYCLLGKGQDTLCDLMDAVITTRGLPSFAELSLSPVFRRQWSSLYKVLDRSDPPREQLMKLYAEYIPDDTQVVIAGDHTAWQRLWSKTLKERTYEHQPTVLAGTKPVTVGQGYSTLAWIPEQQGSWVLPLLHERITTFETPLTKAAEQLKQVCHAILGRSISLWDSEYGCARFIQLTADIACDKLIRLRSNRVLYGPPPPYSGWGRPRKHGDKFKLNESNTWWSPTQQADVQDEKLGHLRLRCWSDLHFQQAATHSLQLILVERLNASGQRTQKPLWLIWTGEKMPSLDSLWTLYLRRFALEHWYRFIKHRLHWTLPHLSTREQTQSWSDLMPLITWQLWLARNDIQDHPLPWQKPLTKLTPGRVANAFAIVLANIGTPAKPPKLRGKSPGWPKGRPRVPRTVYPIVKKSYSKPKAAPKSAA